MPLMNHILLKDYIEDSKSAVHHCGGIPLALEVLGSSLSCHSIDFWRRALLEPQAIGDGKIQRILRISYDSLQDERHKSLFLDIACFSIGTDKYYLKKIIEGCDFYRITGIQKLIDKCLITIDKDEEVMMHQLLRDMGRETVRQESPEDPGKLSRLWRHKDALSVLRKNTATESIRRFIFAKQENTTCSSKVDLKTETFVKMSNCHKSIAIEGIKLLVLYSTTKSQLSIMSLALLPSSLVKLSLSNSNITNDVIPEDLSYLPSLEYLDPSGNPIHSLTKSLRSLSKLESLLVNHCKSLRSLPEFSTILKDLWALSCIWLRSFLVSVIRSKKLSLDDITWALAADCPNKVRSHRLNANGCEKLVQVQGYFNLELIRDVDSEIKNNMHLFNVESVKGIEVEMVNSLTQTYNITPPQVLHERGTFSVFLPGSEIPNLYGHQNEDSLLDRDMAEGQANLFALALLKG
ncbi:disease resistance protein RPP2B [Jatropha curcas]|uniref:disease resistance protein RPP2B n=1 Tax=Jatropha curcas TaxID=180498 RepID=UPI0005FB420B|nr:disease resistance protein RPP2B [Jatropha curcas]